MSMLEKISNHPLYIFPNFRKFFLADVLVALAERSFAITFAWWIISQEGENNIWLGILMSLEALPILILSPFIGPLIDRYNKKTCMFTGVMMQLLFVSIVGYLLYIDKLAFAALCGLSFLMSCFVPQFEDSVNASVGLLVDEDHLSRATAIQSSSIEFSNIFAAVISTSVIAAFGVLAAVGVNIFMYLAGAAFIYFIKADLSPQDNTEDSEDNEDEDDYISELKAGIHYILGNKALISYCSIYALEIFFTIPIFILIPMLVKEVLHESVGWVAVFETSLSIGSVLMAFFMSFREEYRNFYRKYATSLLLIGLCMLGLAFSGNKYIMTAVIFFIGVLFAALMALSFIMFQNVIPKEFKGRFFGIMSTIAAGMAPVSYMWAGLATDTWSIETVLTISGVGAFILAGAMLNIPRLREHIGKEVKHENICS